MPSDNRDLESRIQYTTESIIHCFDFTNFSEVLGGATLSSPSVVDVDGGSGLTIGSLQAAAVLGATFTEYLPNSATRTVASGKGVKVSITGSAGEYEVACTVTESGGGTLTRRMLLTIK